MTAQRERFFCRLVFLTLLTICLFSPHVFSRDKEPLPGGALKIVDGEGRSTGACPLEHTDVDVTITGFFARVKVKQVFRNPLSAKIEAVYVFPMSRNAAVDDMVMVVGDRCVRSRIAKRDEARREYERAKARGHVAGLLDQERPNIFTQSVALSLGLIGDIRAIPPLLGLLDDPGANPIARAFAAVALGRIGEKNGRSWSGTLLTGINYRAKVDAISEALDIL